MNKLNILKSLKSIQIMATIAAVSSAVAGTVMVVKAVRQYHEDATNPANNVLIAYSSDEDTKKVTEKLQKDARNVIAASIGTVAVSGIFALIAHKAYVKRLVVSTTGIIDSVKATYETALDSTYSTAANLTALSAILCDDDPVNKAKELIDNKDSISELIDQTYKAIYFQGNQLAEITTKKLVDDRKTVYEQIVEHYVRRVIDRISEKAVK